MTRPKADRYAWGMFRSILVLLIAIFLMMAGGGPLTTMIAVRLQGGDGGALVIGAVLACYFLGLTLGSLFTFRLVVRVGHIRAFTAFASVLSATALAYSFTSDYALWGGLRLAEGYCTAGIFICIESWLNEQAEAKERGRILALYMAAMYMGQAGGQFLLNLQTITAFLPFLAVSMLVSAAVVPVALTRMAPPVLPDIAAASFKKLFQTSPLGITGAVASGLVMASLYTLGPVFVREVGLSISDTAIFMSAAIFGGVVLQWPVGKLSDLLDRRGVIVGALLAIASASALMVIISKAGAEWLFAASVVYGGATFALYPLCVAHTNDHLDRSERIPASGGLILAFSVGATLGPLAASGVMSALGPNGLFLFTCAVGLLVAAFGMWRMRAVPAPEKEPYQPLPRSTPALATLDPLAEEPVAEEVPPEQAA